MKKKKFTGITALLPLILFDLAAMPVSAEVTDYQETGAGLEETKDECQVIYKSIYDFSETIPKYPELEDAIKLSDTNGTVKVDDSISFTVDTGGKTFDVVISDPTIAKLTVKDGVVTVTGLRKGTTTITIICNGKSATYVVTVVAAKSNDSNSINNPSDSTKKNDSDSASNIQTGDENHILIYGAMLIASIFGLVRSRGRKEKRKL